MVYFFLYLSLSSFYVTPGACIYEGALHAVGTPTPFVLSYLLPSTALNLRPYCSQNLLCLYGLMGLSSCIIHWRLEQVGVTDV